MNALIIDDEQASHTTLETLIQLNHQDVQVIGHAYGVEQGIKEVNHLQPDLLFLDIEMPDGTGFDLLKEISHQSLAVVFITAHNKYALTALRFNAIDYLLKPVSDEALKAAIEVSKEKLVANSWQQELADIKAMIQQITQQQLPKRLKIRTAGYTPLIPTDEITFLEADQGYTEIHQSSGQRVVVSGNLIEYEKLFKLHQNFMRIHKSYLINLDYVRGWSDGQVTLSTGQVVYVGRKYLPQWRAWLNSL